MSCLIIINELLSTEKFTQLNFIGSYIFLQFFGQVFEMHIEQGIFYEKH